MHYMIFEVFVDLKLDINPQNGGNNAFCKNGKKLPGLIVNLRVIVIMVDMIVAKPQDHRNINK